VKANRILITSLLSIISISLSANLTRAQTTSDDQKFLTATRSSYGLLKRQGLLGFAVSVIPNWATMFKDVPVKDRPKLIRTMSRLRFVVEVGANANFHVTHSLVGPKPASAQAQALDNFAKAVDLSVTSFFMTWSPFMLTYPIPEKLDQFVLQDLEDRKVLTYKQSAVDVTVVVKKDYEIKELSTPQGSVKPIFRPDKSGFILTGYEGSNEDPIVGKVLVNGRVELAPVQGFLLPKTVFITGNAGSTPLNYELSFVGYRLKRKA
jgi:hypothetical protein